MKKTVTVLAMLPVMLVFTACSQSPDQQGSMSGMMDHASHIGSEKDFLIMMIPHHQEAITSSEYMLTRNPSPELKAFLEEVISAQTREVETMKGWLKAWYGMENLPESTYQAMMPRLDALSDAEAATAYIEGMILHHQGAVDMAKAVSNLKEKPAFVSFTDHIVTVQTKEIEQLKEMLKKGPVQGSGARMRGQ